MKNRKKNQNLNSKPTEKPKHLVTIMAIFVIFFLGFSLIRNIGKVSKVKKEIKDREVRVSNLRNENDRLKKTLNDSQTGEFVEKQIRDKLGLAKQGEIVLVLPGSDLLMKLAPDLPKNEATLPLKNWEKWYRLFF